MVETSCACTDSRRCEFHARQPRPCPKCLVNGRSGQLQRYAKHDGQRRVIVAGTVDGYARKGDDAVHRAASSEAFWACNVCEYCE